jgi:DNA modification methylase
LESTSSSPHEFPTRYQSLARSRSWPGGFLGGIQGIHLTESSRGDYHWQHEPCWYAVRAKGKGHWAGDRKQTTLWQIANRDQDADTVHGTQKPVECMRRPILNNSSPGQAVYEPFMGSGTTLIAAETTGASATGSS